MAQVAALKLRIESIKKTAAITKAMHRIAASKLNATQNLLTQYLFFKGELDELVRGVARRVSNHKLLQSNHEVEKRLFVLITSDRGLAGGYHQQLFNAFLQETKELAKESIVLLTIGRKGFFFGRKHQYQMVNEEHISNRDQISGTNYAMYVEIIEKMFLNKQIKDITLVYNHFVNALKQEVKFETLLPVSFTDDEFSMAEEHDYLYEGHPNDIFENMILIYLQSRIYGVMVDAKLAEFSSRIVAMKQATDNSNDVLEKLELQYNQARQHKITADLLDISNGKIGN